jgi:hypothetical protein
MLGKDKLDKLVAVAFDTVEGEAPPDAFIGAAMLIVEVRIKDGDGQQTGFYTFSTDARGWIQRALLEEAQAAQTFSVPG